MGGGRRRGLGGILAPDGSFANHPSNPSHSHKFNFNPTSLLSWNLGFNREEEVRAPQASTIALNSLELELEWTVPVDQASGI